MPTQEKVLDQLMIDMTILKNRIPNGEVAKLEASLKQIDANQREMAGNLKSLTEMIVDPKEGIIVATNKNTVFRESCEKNKQKTMDQFNSVLRWKGVIDNALWVLFTCFAGIIIKLIFFN